MLSLDLDGIRFDFEIEGYHPSTKENWDDEWCNVIAGATSRDLNYSINSTCMLCSEVEWLHDKLVELSEGLIKELEEITFIEPDFEYKLYPGKNYYMEWKFNLWDGGVLTCNSISITFCDDDIKELIKYLDSVVKRGKGLHMGFEFDSNDFYFAYDLNLEEKTCSRLYHFHDGIMERRLKTGEWRADRDQLCIFIGEDMFYDEIPEEIALNLTIRW